MAYRDDLSALSPDNGFILDGNANDSIGSANGTNSGGVFTGPAICEDATNSWETNGLTDRIVFPTTATINNSAQSVKGVGFWYQTTGFQGPPTRLYGEGTQTLCFQVCMGFGNNLIFEVVDTGYPTGLQIYGPPIVPNRSYYIFPIFLGSGNGNLVRLLVDGVEYFQADPVDRQPDAASLAARGVGNLGDPSGTTGLGGSIVLQQAARNGRYSFLYFWDGAVPTDTEIREEAFEKGASAGVTITNQAGLDALADTLRPNESLNIRVDVASGDLTLTADNVTHDLLASIHVQWMSTGVLTWRNDNGSNASLFSTPNGGSVVVQNETSFALTGLQNPTEVTVLQPGTQTIIASQENVTTGTYAVDVFEDIVDVTLVTLQQQNETLKNVDTSADVSLEVSQLFDRQYLNP